MVTLEGGVALLPTPPPVRHVFCPPPPPMPVRVLCLPQTTVVGARCGSEARRPPSAERTDATWLVASCLRWPSRSCGSLGRLGRRGGLICLGDGRLSESLSPRSPASNRSAPPLRESFCHSLSACAWVGK